MDKIEVLRAACVGGNMGAASALERFEEKLPLIDERHGADVYMATLIVSNIYDSRLWMLWKDVCGQDPVKFAAVVMAIRHGLVPMELVQEAADRTRYRQEPDADFKHDVFLNAETCVDLVRAACPGFLGADGGVQ